MKKGKLIEIECEICGVKFIAGSNYIKQCPECRKYKHYRFNIAGVRNDEEAIKARAIERAKHNDRIIGKGYAERQIADTLKMVGKVKIDKEV